MMALWTQAELSAALGAAPSSPLSTAVNGVSIDSRTLEAGDLFFAIKGDAHDGHDHVARAFEAGAAAAVVSRERAQELAPLGPVFAVDDTLKAMERLGVAARARSKAKIVAVTGSVGKTTAKEMLRAMLTAMRRYARLGRFLQQPLGRAADARAHAGRCTLRRVRDGHEPRGRDHAAHAHGAAACRARDDDRARPHRASRLDRSDRRREGGDLPRPRASRNRGLESRRSAVRAAGESRAARGARVWSFGRGADCDAQLLEVEAIDGGSRVRARVLAHELTFELGAPGLHMAQNALGALLAAEALRRRP